MSYLGVKYKLIYVSKFYISGFTNITARVKRPDGVDKGPFPMTAMDGDGFSGIYEYEYITTVDEPEGQYLAILISPSENVRDTHRFGLFRRPLNTGVIIRPSLEKIDLTITQKIIAISSGPEEPVVGVQMQNTNIQLLQDTINVVLE